MRQSTYKLPLTAGKTARHPTGGLPARWVGLFASALLVGAAASAVAAGSLTGRVTDARTGEPIAGASVVVEGADRGAETDAQGAFEIHTVAGGRYIVTASHVGYGEAPGLEVVIPQEGATTIQLVLHPRAIPLQELEVLAEPVGAVDIHRSPSFVTVIERSQFEGKVTSVPEVLAKSTGLQVNRLGGLGSFSTLTIRGSSAEQVEVYLDGILLNSALGGSVNLENLPLSQVGQVEVYRGAAATGTGMGGTVHIRTLTSDRSFRAGGSASWGVFDTRSLSAMASDRLGSTRYVAVADYSSSDSDFGFLDDNGTIYNLDDDVWTSRQNSDFLAAGLLLKVSHHLSPRLRFYGQENLYWKHQGMPGISNNQAKHARYGTFRSLSEVGIGFEGPLSLSQRLFYTHLGESFRDAHGEIGIGNQDNRYRTRTYGWDRRVQIKADAGHLTLGAALKREAFLPAALLGRSVRLYESSRRTASLQMGGDVRLPSDRGLISASVGLEHHRSHTHDENVHGYSSLAPDTVSTKTLFSVRGGARFDLGPGILFKANVGRSYRSPSFFELFGDRGGVFGNTDLVPELAVTWDAGMRITSRGVVLEAGTFDHRYRDLIQFIQNSQAVSRPTNIGNARVRGLETTLGLQLTRWTAVSGNYTYQRTRDESKAGFQRGKALPNRPTHEAYGSLALLPGRWRFSYEYTYQAGNYRDRANLRRVPARHVHNVAVRRRIYNDVAVTAEAKNLLGSQIADLWGYPLPGRSVFVTVQDSY